MEIVLIMITLQGLLGAFDNLWHHEITEKLPQKRSARFELTLHTIREFIYSVIFFLLAWYECRGGWAYLLCSLFIIEIIVTLWDFLEEDRTRKLPGFERVLHTILAINFGCILALLIPELMQWATLPTELHTIEYGIWSWILTVYSAGVFVWAIRDLCAVIKLGGVPTWKRRPFFVGQKANPRTLLITGATGFIGRSLCRTLIKNGDKVIALTRDYEKAEDMFGPSVRIITDLLQLDNDIKIDAVVSLAGAPVIGGLWTEKRKQILISSRIDDLKNIKALVERLKTKPSVLVNASAIGFYGITQDEIITEDSSGQNRFQSQLCQKRELAALELEQFGLRVCNLRIGLVFDNDGGAFPSMSRPIRYGLGAILGSGKQWISWIYKPDLIRVILFTLSQEQLSGAINATSPEPVTNRTFTETIANGFNRPVLFSLPAHLIKVLLGELSELFIEGQKVIPNKLLNAGFRFNQPTIDSMMKAISNEDNLNSNESTEVYYNESCPICALEMSHYKVISTNNSCNIQFTDINKNSNMLAEYYLSDADLERRLYAFNEKAQLVSGIDAFISIWKKLPQYQWLSTLLQNEVIYSLADMTYEYLMVPALAFYNSSRKRFGTYKRDVLQ